jgi:aminopeptidase-like protein
VIDPAIIKCVAPISGAKAYRGVLYFSVKEKLPMIAIDDTRDTGDTLVADLLKEIDPRVEGEAAYALIERLYPFCRSITGNGVRRSLRLLRETIPLALREVVSHTQAFDWTVPDEWNIRDAYIMNETGERLVDFRKSNLHVLNYSTPINRMMSLAELRPHLFTIPEAPDWIPYRTSYYQKNWGFCLTQRQLDKLEEGEYHVYIDSSLHPGHLTYGEFRIQGETDDEVLISCHCCHPSLCNDNLSGIAVAARLAALLNGLSLRYSYRFLWIPGTIGSITWLALNEEILPRIKHGLVLSCVGDSGKFTYKRSRRGNAEIDRAVEYELIQNGRGFEVLNFAPDGYDERQYCSPGINLPVGCFMRTPNGCYPEYHTSADDLSLVSPSAMGESLAQLLGVIQILEQNRRYVNLNSKCEPQLGRRGLYRQIGGMHDPNGVENAMFWVLNFSDGEHDLLDIAVRSGIEFQGIGTAAELLREAGLLKLV